MFIYTHMFTFHEDSGIVHDKLIHPVPLILPHRSCPLQHVPAFRSPETSYQKKLVGDAGINMIINNMIDGNNGI